MPFSDVVGQCHEGQSVGSVLQVPLYAQAERCLQTHLERELAADLQDRLTGWQRCLQKSACHTDKANENL